MAGVKKITCVDILIVLFVLFAIIGLFYLGLNGNLGIGEYLKVKSPNGEYIYALNENREISIAGKLGDTIIHIENGKAKILFSPCPHKTCMARPEIYKTGEWIVCLPNEVFLQIESNGTSAEIVY